MQIQRGAYSTLWLCIGLTFPYSQPWSRSLRVWLLGYGAFSRNSAEGSPWDWIWDLSIPFTSFIILNYSQIFCWYIQEMLDLVLLFYSVKKVGVPGWWRWEFQQVCVCMFLEVWTVESWKRQWFGKVTCWTHPSDKTVLLYQVSHFAVN